MNMFIDVVIQRKGKRRAGGVDVTESCQVMMFSWFVTFLHVIMSDLNDCGL